MKKFITFGGGSSNFHEAGNRIVTQAKNLNLFDECILFTDQDLKNDSYFWNNHSTFIEKNRRGYGYWLWKPYLIKKTMKKMKDGDILLYLDCGCEIDINKKQKIIDYFELVKNDYIIGSITYDEKEWTKMDLILKLDMLDDKYLNVAQRQGGTNLFLICDKTRDIVDKLYDLASDYHNIDDSPSIHKNLDGFKEHRQDQSIFSLLTKKYNIYSKHNLREVFCINRNRSGISKL